MIILYNNTSLKLLIRSENFLVESLGSFMCRIISSRNKKVLISSFPIPVPLSPPPVISLANISSKLKSGGSRHCCLVPDLSGDAFIFSNLVDYWPQVCWM